MVDHVRPRSCKISRNGYHEADTWDMTFDLRVFPFDPEGIASLAVRIYMWDETYGQNYEWATDGGDNDDGNEMIRGLADEESIKIDKSQNEFHCSGRDYTSIMDPEWDTTKQIPAGIPLQQAVQYIADQAAPLGPDGKVDPHHRARFNVVWDVIDDKGNPLPASRYLSNGEARSTKKKGMWVKQGKTHWDVIYDLVIQNGFICFVQGSSIVITNPRTQTSAALTSAPTVAYGLNLRSFESERKMAKQRVPRIKISYWDGGGKRQFDVVYPEKDQKITIGLGVKKNEDLVYPAPTYCHSKESAQRFAKMMWELIARGETTYKFVTRHMTVPRGVGANYLASDQPNYIDDINGFMMLRLQAGSAIAVRFDPFQQESMRSLTSAQREDFLLSLGYHPAVASFVANNIDRLEQFRQPFYVRTINYDYSHGDGLKIECEAVNFAYERREIQWADGAPKSDAIDAVSGA